MRSNHLSKDEILGLIGLVSQVPPLCNGLIHLLRQCPECRFAAGLVSEVPQAASDHHLTAAVAKQMSELVALNSGGVDLRAPLHHLLESCRVCSEAARQILLFLPVDRPTSAAEREVGFDRLFERVSDRVAEFRLREMNENGSAKEICRELLELTPARRHLRIKNSKRFQTWALTRILCEKSFAAVTSDPDLSVSLAELAVEISLELSVDRYEAKQIEDFRATAKAHLGNALRVSDDLRGAEQMLALAQSHAKAGSKTVSVRAEILSFLASLRNCQRRFAEAIATCDEVLEIYGSLGERHKQGKALVARGGYQIEVGELDSALRDLSRARTLIDSQADPRLALYADYNLLVLLTEAERFEDAAKILPQVRSLTEAIGKRADLVRLRWTEARIERSLKRHHRAEAAFLEVRRGFLQASQGYDAALVSLELATLYAEQRRTSELKVLAEELYPVFQSLGIEREAMATLRLFVQAAAAEAATVAVVKSAVEALENARGLAQSGGAAEASPAGQESS